VLDLLAGTLLRAKKKNEQEPEAMSSLWTFLQELYSWQRRNMSKILQQY
jgi:hypothetical protein